MRTKSTILVMRLALAFAVGGIWASSVSAQDPQRTVKNYQDVMSGRKKLDQLTATEQSEVVRLHRLVQARAGSSNDSSNCQNAKSQAQSTASDLANYSRRLRSCAEAEDFSDDCSTEFRRVRNAQSDYESAVSAVSGACR